MILYELINPSDSITFYAQDDNTAFVVALLVGNGCYDARRPDGEGVGAVLMFASALEARAVIKAKLGADLDQWIPLYQKELAAALTSFAVCGTSDREAYDLACQADPTFRERNHDQKCSSLNDICAIAWRAAKHMQSPVVQRPVG